MYTHVCTSCLTHLERAASCDSLRVTHDQRASTNAKRSHKIRSRRRRTVVRVYMCICRYVGINMGIYMRMYYI